MLKIGLRQSMRNFLKNFSAEFHTDLIWNDGAVRFLRKSPQAEEERWLAIWYKFLIQKYHVYLTTFYEHLFRCFSMLFSYACLSRAIDVSAE